MQSSRYREIDFLRGLAVVLMVIFNYAFTLAYFQIYAVAGGWLFWFLFPRIIASIFIFLAGVSFTLSYSRISKKSGSYIYKKYFIRGAKIFLLGLLITAATWIFVPQGAIIFGILHLIGISIIIAPLFRNFKRANLFLGLLFIIIGIYLQNFTIQNLWLSWLGLIPKNFYTFDYFPIFPWFGVILLGIFAGNTLYANGKRRFQIRDFSSAMPINFFQKLGRNSLLIYLLHQPILIAVLYVLGFTLF